MGVAHPFAHRAHFNSTSGQICHCPWGHKTATHLAGWTVEASKIDWLRETILKGKNAERNKYWLKWMENNGYVDDKTDKMLPWLYNQFKKSVLLPTEEGGRAPLQYPYAPAREEEGSDWFGRKKHYENVAPDRIPEVFNHDDKGRLLNLKEYHGQQISPDDIRDWAQELDHSAKHGRGVNIDDYDAPDLHNIIKEHARQREGEEHAASRDNSLGEVVHQFDDGWTMRQLQNLEEMEDEGNEMGHCVGNPEHGCPQRFENERGVFHSLRDPNNIAHATIEHTPDSEHQEAYDPEKHEGWGDHNLAKHAIPRIGPNSQLAQFYGKSDASPTPEYEDRINEWLAPHGLHATGGEHMEGLHEEDEPEEYGEVEVPAPENMYEYNQIHGNGEYHEYLPDGGYGVGENTEIIHQDPDHEQLAYDYLSSPWQTEHHENSEPLKGQTDLFYDPGGESPEDQQYALQEEEQRRWREETKRQQAVNAEKERKQFFDAAYERNEHEDLRTAMEAHVLPYSPYAGEEFADPRDRTPEAQKEWQLYNQWRQWEQEAKAQAYPNNRWKTAPMMQPENFRGYHLPQDPNTPWTYARPATEEEMQAPPSQQTDYQMRHWFPERQYYRYEASATTAPLYYRWVYSPSKGVTLGSNQDDHPALVKYHQGLGGDINDTDLTHGYAYPIINGWRLSDLDHQPVEDPYIVNQVVRALNHDESPEIRSEGSWQPVEFDWQRIHYGLPKEASA